MSNEAGESWSAGKWFRRWWLHAVIAGSSVVLIAVASSLLGAELGNVGEWLSGAGTVAALGVSLYVLNQQGHDRRRIDADRRREEHDRERHQARQVTCWVGTAPYPDGSLADPAELPCVYVRNDSDQPIWSVVVQPEPFDPDGRAHSSGWAIIRPRETSTAAEWPYSHDEPAPARPVVSFTDANGVTWQRDGIALKVLERGNDTPDKLLGFDMVVPPIPMG